jgi:hypothetical protein
VLTNQHLFAGSTDQHCKIFHWGSRIFHSDSRPYLPPASLLSKAAASKQPRSFDPAACRSYLLSGSWAGVPGSDHAFLAEDKPIEADELSSQDPRTPPIPQYLKLGIAPPQMISRGGTSQAKFGRWDRKYHVCRNLQRIGPGDQVTPEFGFPPPRTLVEPMPHVLKEESVPLLR